MIAGNIALTAAGDKNWVVWVMRNAVGILGYCIV
jgi:hypothetical protein